MGALRTKMSEEMRLRNFSHAAVLSGGDNVSLALSSPNHDCCRRFAGLVDLVSLGLFMNKTRSSLISFHSQSSAIARVCPALLKTGSEAAWQRHNHKGFTGVDPDPYALHALALANHHPRHPCAMLQFP